MAGKKGLAAAVAVAGTLLVGCTQPFIEPGLWQQTLAVSDSSGRTVPEQTVEHCLTPDDVRNLRTLVASSSPPECTMTDYRRDMDRVRWHIVCNDGTDIRTQGEMGRASATRYRVKVDTVARNEQGEVIHALHFDGQAHRIGACPQ